MDVSKEYIKMCEKATEIQYTPSVDYVMSNGDFTFNKHTNRVEVHHWGLSPFTIEYTRLFDTGGIIWLPRLDQLQEMIWVKDSFGLIHLLHDFAQGVKPYTYSMEQIWLAFIMLELYHKEWYNGEWRCIDDRDTRTSKVAF